MAESTTTYFIIGLLTLLILLDIINLHYALSLNTAKGGLGMQTAFDVSLLQDRDGNSYHILTPKDDVDSNNTIAANRAFPPPYQTMRTVRRFSNVD